MRALLWRRGPRGEVEKSPGRILILRTVPSSRFGPVSLFVREALHPPAAPPALVPSTSWTPAVAGVTSSHPYDSSRCQESIAWPYRQNWGSEKEVTFSQGNSIQSSVDLRCQQSPFGSLLWATLRHQDLRADGISGQHRSPCSFC